VNLTSIVMASLRIDQDESVQFICSVAKLIPPVLAVLIDLVSSDDEETMENVSERFYRSIRAKLRFTNMHLSFYVYM